MTDIRTDTNRHTDKQAKRHNSRQTNCKDALTAKR